jgi:uncharacterized protein DUF4926
MAEIRTRIQVGPDHTITGIAPPQVPPGEHLATITVSEPPLPELSVVALLHPVECKGGVLPEGGKGTVVHVYRGGEHYEVEFAEPFPCTVTLRRDDIHPE